MNFALVLLALLPATPGGDCLGAAATGASTTMTTTTTTTTTLASGRPAAVNWQAPPNVSEDVTLRPPGSARVIDATKVTLPPTGGVVRVFELDRPQITASSWVIEGNVKYENVKGNGYLEMWSHFPDGSAYFSRTLDTSGPMGVLHGQSEWRAFKLPFVSAPGKVPAKLEVNLVLPEGGVVWLAAGTLKDGLMSEPAVPRAATKASGGVAPVTAAWWGPAQGGRIGGAVGTLLGLYGALIGILASRGRGRGAVTALMVAVGVACAVMLAVGVVALVRGQPYAVWYPLTLAGGLGAVLSAGLLPVMNRRFEEAEMRRMMALDA